VITSIAIITLLLMVLIINDAQKEMHEAQISKLHGEMSRLRELLVEYKGKERETQSIINDLRMSLSDLQNLVRCNVLLIEIMKCRTITCIWQLVGVPCTNLFHDKNSTHCRL